MGIYPGGHIVRVTPTVETDAYADADVIHHSTEIPGAVSSRGGVSILQAAYMIDEDSGGVTMNHIFTQKAAVLGTVNATANISHADLITSNVIGVMQTSNSFDTDTDIDNAQITQFSALSGASESPFYPLMVQAEPDSTSIYFGSIFATGGDTYTNADALQFIFHFKYLG